MKISDFDIDDLLSELKKRWADPIFPFRNSVSDLLTDLIHELNPKQLKELSELLNSYIQTGSKYKSPTDR